MSDLVKQQAKTAEKLVKNSLWLFTAEALSKLIALATQAVAARYLGEGGYGVFSFAFAVAGAFIVFIDVGLGVYITRELTRRPERSKSFRAAFFITSTSPFSSSLRLLKEVHSAGRPVTFTVPEPSTRSQNSCSYS